MLLLLSSESCSELRFLLPSMRPVLCCGDGVWPSSELVASDEDDCMPLFCASMSDVGATVRSAAGVPSSRLSPFPSIGLRLEGDLVVALRTSASSPTSSATRCAPSFGLGGLGGDRSISRFASILPKPGSMNESSGGFHTGGSKSELLLSSSP
jgi:hypothetical protein